MSSHRHDRADPIESPRTSAFGEDYRLSTVDRLGIWLSVRAVTRHVGSLTSRHHADIGSGYEARLARSLGERAASTTVVDVSLSDAVKADPRLTAIEGQLPAVLTRLGDATMDVITCISVLEHVWDDLGTLRELRRILAGGGVLIVNVPSWWGKTALETSAFKLGLSPASEMNDHKRYYDPRDLWPLLVKAGFVPEHITCRRHKLGLNTLAVCRTPGIRGEEPRSR